MAAHRCGSCDELWHHCVDKTYVHGGRGSATNAQKASWSYTGWQDPAEDGQTQRRPKSPRAKSAGKKSPRGGRRGRPKAEALVPTLDPPWNAKHATTTPSTASSSSNAQAESQLQNLVMELKKPRETPLSAEEIEQLIEETTTPVITSKNVHSAVSKVDQARSKLQTAQKARQKLHEQWSAYLEQSIARWRGFAEDFSSRDKDLEEKVTQAREKLQEARTYLDKAKELHSKQDRVVLDSAPEMISDGEEDGMKIEAAEVIRQGIDSVVTNLENIRVRPAEAQDDEPAAAKKPRVGDSGRASAALQPFGKPDKPTS